MEQYSVKEVFTPTSPAVLTFVERESINQRLVDDLGTRGKQLIVYGHTGSGKTTLLENKLRQMYENHITTRCTSTLTFDQLIQHALADLDSFYDAERQTKRTAKITAGVAGELATTRSHVGVERSSEHQTKQVRMLPPPVTPQTLAHLLGKAKSCWVLEDFHKIDKSEKQKLSQVMKLFMDMSVDYSDLKIIAIGAVDTARQVVEYDSEMQNRVAEIQVPLMTPEELEKIITLGEQYLNITIDPRVRHGIVQLSNGLAAACHQLCLNFCLENGIEGTASNKVFLDTDRYRRAISRYCQDASDSLKSTFDKAFRRSRRGRFQHARIILRALVKFDQEGAERADLADMIRTRNPNYPIGDLTKHLHALTEGSRGAILRYDSTSGRYSFSEPIQRAFAYALFEINEKKHVPGLNFDQLIPELLPALAKALAKLGAK